MKTIQYKTILLLVFALGALSIRAGDFSAEWNAAAEAYQARDYDQARAQYETILQNSVVPTQQPHPDLTYNLGNVYYKQGQMGLAAWMYEKTLTASPRHADARQNLELVRQTAEVPTSEIFFLFKPLSWLSNRFTTSEWAQFFALCYVSAAVLGSLWILAAKKRRLRRIIGVCFIFAACLVFVAVAFLAPRYYQTEILRHGVVVQSGVVVRSEPAEDADQYFEALECERLELSEARVKGWWRVKRPADGRIGYLPETVAREI